MTLTYRGQKYVQNNAAAQNSKRPVLMYRGQKVAQSAPSLMWLTCPASAGLFIAVSQRLIHHQRRTDANTASP